MYVSLPILSPFEKFTVLILSLQYLGEEGDHCQLKAAVLCASPWNLDVSSAHLQSTWLGKEVYSKTMGSSMKRLFEA
jgi:predicted alpha/beta-fold hydrolase